MEINYDNYIWPIEVVYGEVRTELEKNIVKAVQDCNIKVNKEELEQALLFHKTQYENGYMQGYKDGYREGLDDAFKYAARRLEQINKRFSNKSIVKEDTTGGD